MAGGPKSFLHLKNYYFLSKQRGRPQRDILLPKLISGELDISDLDIAVREQEV